jgi:hypothetical protein
LVVSACAGLRGLAVRAVFALDFGAATTISGKAVELPEVCAVTVAGDTLHVNVASAVMAALR